MADEISQSHDGFHHRGEAMTRIEAFVAAAFAFAVTMMVISVGDVPKTFDQMLYAVKMIPSFAASCACLFWIWHAHATWSRRYGLEDGMAIFLSASLVFLILIYIYPLRLMMQGLFAHISGGYFPSDMRFSAAWELRFMFVFYALGFTLLAINFVCLYGYALKKQTALKLSALEILDTAAERTVWAVVVVISLISLLLGLVLPIGHISLSGFSYFLLFPSLFYLGARHQKARKALLPVQA